MAQRNSEWDDDGGYDDERPEGGSSSRRSARRRERTKKSGWSVGKILGFGCLALIILGAACGIYAWSQVDEALTPTIVRLVQKTKDGTGGLTSGERDQVSRLLDQVVSLAESSGLSLANAGIIVINLEIVNKDSALEKHEAEWLLKFLQAVIDAKGDLEWEELNRYNLEEHPLIRPTEDR